MFRPLVILFAAALSVGTAHAGSGSKQSISGTAAARVIQPLTVTHQNGAALNFGTISAGTPGTVTVSPSGAGSTTGGARFAIGSTTAADRLRVWGTKFRRFSVATGPGVVRNGSASMKFTTTPSVSSGLFANFGFAWINVGGTLSIKAGQPLGTYTGSYPVIAYYD